MEGAGRKELQPHWFHGSGAGFNRPTEAKKGMLCDAAPNLEFLNALDAREDPEQARIATQAAGTSWRSGARACLSELR